MKPLRALFTEMFPDDNSRSESVPTPVSDACLRASTEASITEGLSAPEISETEHNRYLLILRYL